MPRTLNLSSSVEKLRGYYLSHGRLPSFSEMQKLFGYSSKGAVAYLVRRLGQQGIIRKDETGRLLPTPALAGGTKLLGSIQAGFPSPAEEELVDTLSLDEFLIKKPQATYLVKVTGDSMIDAGIHAGDLILVEKGRTARSGDIVVAQVDGSWTLKRLERKGRKVLLRAENKKYPAIEPKEELIIGGVVIANVRKYH